MAEFVEDPAQRTGGWKKSNTETREHTPLLARHGNLVVSVRKMCDCYITVSLMDDLITVLTGGESLDVLVPSKK